MSVDGGAALNLIATHYFKGAGGIVQAVIATLACLKTAVGLVTSCGEMYSQIFPKGPAYRVWAIVFCVVTFLISTMGLSAITAWSLPVLMFLYPLAITLILLALFGKLFHHNRVIYISVTACTLVTALFDLVQSLPYRAAGEAGAAQYRGSGKSAALLRTGPELGVPGGGGSGDRRCAASGLPEKARSGLKENLKEVPSGGSLFFYGGGPRNRHN